MTPPAYFDEFAADYDAALGQGLSVTGEEKDYFAHGRIAWLARCLRTLGERPRHVLDYGCGTGSSSKLALDLLGPESVVGVDNSARSVEIARQVHGTLNFDFLLPGDYPAEEKLDLVYCNGVFHHIPRDQRAEAVQYIFDRLKPGGLFSLWENNPWNLGTRLVMSRIPFDRDAITLDCFEARRLLRSRFEIVRTDFLFIFPRVLSKLRAVEPYLSQLPLGGQFQVLCRKPLGSPAGS
jgi:SAM-dependent methyltransferase